MKNIYDFEMPNVFINSLIVSGEVYNKIPVSFMYSLTNLIFDFLRFYE